MTRARGAWVLAAVIAVAGAVGVFAVERHIDSTHHHAVTQADTGANAVEAARIQRISTRVALAAGVLRGLDPSAQPGQLVKVARADFGSLAVAHAGRPLAIDPHGSIGSRQALTAAGASNVVLGVAATARDVGTPVSAVVDVAGKPSLVVAWPLYQGPVLTTADRRASSTGWLIGIEPMDLVTQPIVDTAAGFGDHVAVDSTESGPGDVHTVLRDAMAVRVVAVPHGSQVPAIVVGLLTALACGLVIGLGVISGRREREAQRVNDALTRQVRLISDVSVTMQESLDMGHVVPSVLAQMTDRLTLSYASVIPGSSAGGVEMLALGRRPAGVAAREAALDATSASPGELVRLPLRRANRTLGFIEVVAAHGLDSVEFQSLRSTADLLAGALYNADLYEREQVSVRRLRELDELKDDFLSTVSHELRTPLSVIVGFTSLLVKDWDRIPESLRIESLNKIHRHVGSLTNLVNDLLDFISEQRAKAARSEMVDLSAEIRALGEDLRPLCEGKELTVDVADGVSAWTDVRALERIMSNLVGNAAKYSPAGTAILVRLRAGEYATVSVQDEGPGIRPEDRARIFERFYRGDSDAARATRGSGIGLAVVLAWVRAVGARLDISSTPGEGTTMTVQFPMTESQAVDGAGTVTWRDTGTMAEELIP